MDLPKINTMTMLERKMDHATLQLKVAGENITQARIPGSTAREVKPLNFKNVLHQAAIAQTNPAHLKGSRSHSNQIQTTAPQGTTLSNASINSAQELQTADRAASEFTMSVGVYQKQLSLVNMVLGSGN